ncbi:MAG: VanZ family protein [Chloroflexi bacterium]|nr:VanZ family protein [Chloroflexota bacterium]
MRNNRYVFFDKRFRWIPAIIVMLIIFIVSSRPSTQLPNFGWLDLVVKKGGHLIGYGLLANYYLMGIGKQTSQAKLLAWLLVILFAISDEFHQSFVEGRYGSFVDVLIDSFGGGLALLLNAYRS